MSKKPQHHLTADEKAVYRRHIIQCEQAGASVSKYCKLHQLHLNRFLYQRKRLRETKQDTPIQNESFIPAKLKPPATSFSSKKNSSGLVLRLKNGCGLEIPLDTPIDWLGDLLVKAGQLI